MRGWLEIIKFFYIIGLFYSPINARTLTSALDLRLPYGMRWAMAPHLGILEIMSVIFNFSCVASPLIALTTSVASALNGRILASTFPSILSLASPTF